MEALPDTLAVRPLTKPVQTTVRVPGSKSVTNRALAFAALGTTRVKLEGALFSDDTRYMIKALDQLGLDITADEVAQTIEIQGTGGSFPNKTAKLYVGVAGTAARFLTALCAAAPDGVYHIDGTEQMRTRPMKGLLDALESLGAQIESANGFLPLTVRACGLNGGKVRLDAGASTQLLSALLIVAPLTHSDLEIQVSGGAEKKPFVHITRQMMETFGQPTATISPSEDSSATIELRHGIPYELPERYQVEPDATAASYFLSLPLVVGGTIKVLDLHQDCMQGDISYTQILEAAGASIEFEEDGTRCTFAPKNLPAQSIKADFWPISDTFLTLAAIAPLLRGASYINGIEHTRKQETDRVAGMANELKKLGQFIEEETGALTITPSMLVPTDIETYHDHRFAMSFAILGCFNLYGDGSPWLNILNPSCCAKTFPEFFNTLEQVHNA